MSFSYLVQVLWTLGAIALPILAGAGVLWLKSQFPTRAELKAIDDAAKAAVVELERSAEALEKGISDRFERGSAKFGEHDRRLALVEEECKSTPSRQNLQSELSQVSQRLRGVEVGFEAVNRQLGTTNRYLEIIVDKGLKP